MCAYSLETGGKELSRVICFFLLALSFQLLYLSLEFSITDNEENEEQKKKCKMHTSTTTLRIPEKDLDLLKSVKHLVKVEQVQNKIKQNKKGKNRQNKTKSHVCYVKGLASGTVLQFCCLEH